MAVKKSTNVQVLLFIHILKTVHLLQSKGMERLNLFCPKGYTDMFRDNQVPRTSIVK